MSIIAGIAAGVFGATLLAALYIHALDNTLPERLWARALDNVLLCAGGGGIALGIAVYAALEALKS